MSDLSAGTIILLQLFKAVSLTVVTCLLPDISAACTMYRVAILHVSGCAVVNIVE